MFCCSVNPLSLSVIVSEEVKFSLYFLVKKNFYFHILWKKYKFSLKCISQFFFICSIKSPQCADKFSKKFFFSIAIFLSRVRK